MQLPKEWMDAQRKQVEEASTLCFLVAFYKFILGILNFKWRNPTNPTDLCSAFHTLLSGGMSDGI